MRRKEERLLWQGRLVAATLFATLAAGCFAQSDVTITFEVKTAKPLGGGERVYVAGNTTELGMWNPRGLTLVRTDSVSWTAPVRVDRNTEVEFKVTRGSWQNEALLASGRIPSNYRLVARTDTIVSIFVPAWKAGGSMQVTGEVRRHQSLEVPGLKPRDVVVWLPPGYTDNATERYPVLYAQDGQNLFDPATSFAGVDWQIDERADSLIAAGAMRPAIVVGIYNTADRSKEYDDTALGETYRSFVVHTLKPMIDSTYRTLSGPENTAVMGSSMGGLAAFLLMFEYPETFSRAACLSPYFPPALSRKVAGSDWRPTGHLLYIDNGGDALDSRLQKGIDDLLPVLQFRGFEPGHDLMWSRYPDAPHNEGGWAARVAEPLRFMFGK